MNSIVKKLVITAMLLGTPALFAQEGLESLRHVAQPKDASEAAEPFGAVPTNKISLLNLAPVLAPYLNNGPVFGLPGTDAGAFARRTQLTGDWGGLRTSLAKKGLFIDLYTTSVYQEVASGGTAEGSRFVQNVQLSANYDTGRAGLWSGGLFHFTMQGRFGDSAANTFTAGTLQPQYAGLVEPGPLLGHNGYPSEYFLTQALNKKTFLIVGKISTVFFPDQTLFGSNYKYNFANFNLVKNPMTTHYYGADALAGLLAVSPAPNLVIAAGVLDPNSTADTAGKKMFDHVNVYATAIYTEAIKGKPGQISPAFNWSNNPKIDNQSPFNISSPAQAPVAIASLLDLGSPTGIDTHFKPTSYFAIVNGSQYLMVKDPAASVPGKMRSGQPLRGIGVYGRLGYAPRETNILTRVASGALYGHGLADSRPNDSYGVGYYYNNVSSPLKKDISQLSAGTAGVKDEKGVEAFYGIALTPAIRLIPSYQHIWNPIVAEVTKHEDHSDVFLVRLTMAF
ncbi:carbohydrate porin [Granulicella arctica]|uniref:carbohydrate porin n=1 Tax=Granulicella arctica TaxID=940613 RepID=UPI0021E0640A|nr:carbohydrate porin [Granulicella arctica]